MTRTAVWINWTILSQTEKLQLCSIRSQLANQILYCDKVGESIFPWSKESIAGHSSSRLTVVGQSEGPRGATNKRQVVVGNCFAIAGPPQPFLLRSTRDYLLCRYLLALTDCEAMMYERPVRVVIFNEAEQAAR